MANMKIPRTPMREAEPCLRNKNFSEVSLGYSEEEAKLEASRCLNCKTKPCTEGCPVGVKIPEFIEKTVNGNYEGAYETIKETSALPAVCGRVCPQEKQCEGKCIRGIKGESVAIGRLERFVADRHALKVTESNNRKAEQNDNEKKKVAIIGSGPSGLSCAGDLVKLGYKVTVFEALHTFGGVLVYGIPEFRLPKSIVAREISELEAAGVEFKKDMVIGRSFTIDELFENGYSAVFVGTGAGLPRFLGINGESACGVYSANEYLTRVNLMKAYKTDYDTPIFSSKKVAVVGGGNVAMDACRCAKRLGADEVRIIYRRSEDEMPARKEEIHHAKEEGIEFDLLQNPREITVDDKGFVSGMICDKMTLTEPDEKGRRKPVATGETVTYELDTVIVAVGTSPNPLIRLTTPGLDTDKNGCIVTSNGVTTTREGVFAGGDAVTGAATVILAMGAGKQAAAEIHNYIQSKNNN